MGMSWETDRWLLVHYGALNLVLVGLATRYVEGGYSLAALFDRACIFGRYFFIAS